jgi:uncharacterized damage-inducible protein DinB
LHACADLLQHLDAIPNGLLDQRPLPAARIIREFAGHIAIAEWWYTTRVLDDPSAAPNWSEFGDDARQRLERIRATVFEQYFSQLRSMTVSQRRRRFTHSGETWTARKTLRRMVWHELYHLKQIEDRLVLLRPHDML